MLGPCKLTNSLAGKLKQRSISHVEKVVYYLSIADAPVSKRIEDLERTSKLYDNAQGKFLATIFYLK